MAEDRTGQAPDPRIVYADIIDLPHWQSTTRPHMSLYARSAQFASYKALSGYEDMVAEEARLTEAEMQLSDGAIELLNQKLGRIADEIEAGTHPELTFTVFVPDERKAGGKYVDVTDAVKKLDTVYRRVVLMGTEGPAGRNKALDFDKITAIRGGLVDDMDG